MLAPGRKRADAQGQHPGEDSLIPASSYRCHMPSTTAGKAKQRGAEGAHWEQMRGTSVRDAAGKTNPRARQCAQRGCTGFPPITTAGAGQGGGEASAPGGEGRGTRALIGWQSGSWKNCFAFQLPHVLRAPSMQKWQWHDIYALNTEIPISGGWLTCCTL